MAGIDRNAQSQQFEISRPQLWGIGGIGKLRLDFAVAVSIGA
jgi:hypothetical protein